MSFQVIVIGGGHAGVEAAWAAANLLPADTGAPTVALVTLDPSTIGVMSCNPAIGGLAKGQLVREIDALHGLMGLAADATGIQFKVLNSSKGPAVHGPRAQCDKHAYARTVQQMLAARPEIRVIAGSVERILTRGGVAEGVEIGPPRPRPDEAGRAGEFWRKSAFWPEGQLTLHARAVVLTTGTFMRGLMHTGSQQTPGGRFGEAAAHGISASLRELGFELGRLKTGTPPRLKRGTIDWESLEAAPGDAFPAAFSDLSAGEQPDACAPPIPSDPVRECPVRQACPSLVRFPVLQQVDCRVTRTTPEAHEVIRANLHRAPMYSGQIESIGPRYCPSIEDKVVRFGARDTHGVFLEPESLEDDWIYCNGISTSLPADVQDAIVRGMPGCARAQILRYGYAVEYDMVRPHQLLASGMTKLVGGLFLAGQINGTSGYEEAAAQGLVAGLNAARKARGESAVVLGRHEAYIGVLMDDLVTKTPVEPYRMFTSRAEHRLLLRSDNACDRLTPRAAELGLLAGGGELSGRRQARQDARTEALDAVRGAVRAGRRDGVPIAALIRQPEFEPRDLDAWLAVHDPALARRARALGVIETVHADGRYEPFIERARVEIRARAAMEQRPIPRTIRFELLTPLRAEARQSLARFRPETFGQASRLEGMTPADLTLLAVLVGRAGADGFMQDSETRTDAEQP